MELENKVNKDLVRSFIIILCPGLIALTPGILILINAFPNVKEFFTQNSFTSTLIIFTFSTATGLIFENIGSRIEDYLCKKYTSEKEQDYWFKYLTITFEKEPVGQSYLRTVLLRVKFKLSMIPATPVFAFGLLFFLSKYFTLTHPVLINTLIVALTPLIMYYFLTEARDSIVILEKVREELVKKYYKTPEEENAYYKL